MSEYFIVDRVENEKIIIESSSGEMLVITKSNVNGLVKESDVLVRESNMFVVDIKETEARKVRIKKIMKGMWQK